MSSEDNALSYHQYPRPGKVAIEPTKPCVTAHDLSLAYTPGVAEPCRRIAENKEDVYRYTSKGNLVAVVTNGTAVLGLGNIGPEAAKPVMEGKAVLFKSFADIDVFDLELQCRTPEEFINTVEALAPTFGGINLEDIKSPECFYIEKELQKRLSIPVFHDDQHGTAIITAAAFLNALELVKKKIEDIILVVSGAGAAAVSCVELLLSLGLKRENVIMCDSVGVIFEGRDEHMNEVKRKFAVNTEKRTIADALDGADAFLGLSTKGVINAEMLRAMNDNPIVFAMANPDPEIDYPTAKSARKDIIMATGRSDYPNQVNNVLGFPFIFRGALDVRASAINEEMKIAAVKALADLAKETVPESVRRAYGNADFSFGAEYLIPKPFDPRVLYWVAPAVAQAAMDSGVARLSININDYTLELKGKQNHGREMLRGYHGLARRSKTKRIAFPEGSNPKVIKAALMAKEEGVAEPVLLGRREFVEETAERLDVDLSLFEVIDPVEDSRFDDYVEKYYAIHCRRGFTRTDAFRSIRKAHNFACLMLSEGAVDGLICGIDRYYAEMVRPILRIIGRRPGTSTAAACYVVSIRDRLLFLADTAINTDLSAEKLASIAEMTADLAISMDIEPKVAMLSYSNFGSVHHPDTSKVREAAKLVKSRNPDLVVEGEMQADTALVGSILEEDYPFSLLKEPANVLVFPSMQSGNIAYKLLQRLGEARVVGPIILGLKAPAYVMQRHATVDEIFNMTTVAVGQATLKS